MPANRRPSKLLLPSLLALLGAGLAAAGWVFLRDSPSNAGPIRDPGEVSLADAAPTGGAVESLSAADGPALAGDEARTAPGSESERRGLATAAEAELNDALWLEGRVLFPEDTPRDEVVEVVALGRKFKSRDSYRARVASDGRFRVAFAQGTKSGRLDVDALHLFLDKPLSVRLADGRAPKDVTIEPFLGGAVRGTLKLAPGAEHLAQELIGKSLYARAWSSRWSNMVARSAKVDKDLRFELRGLPPELGLDLEFDSNVVTKLAVSDLRAPAGETIERTFDLALGVRVRGRVRSEQGGLPKNIQLEVRVQGGKNDGIGSNKDGGKVLEDGTFDLRGLKPGEITLTCTAPLSVTHKLELGRLENGAVKEGVELVLGAGHSVAGRVFWPDRSPAVDAQVVATGGTGDDDPLNPFSTRYTVRTNANGEFLITGLNAGPYGVLAQAKAAREEGEHKKGPTWKARLENIAADTQGLEVLLVAGYSIEGVVLDDIGAPVTAFGVVATAKDEGKRSFNLARMVSGMYKPEDGRFELGGLLEGGYTVHLNVPGHDDPEPQEITVPSDGATYTFVAPRRAAISGVVVRPDGNPGVRADVVVQGDKGQWSGGGEDKADNQGRFQIRAAQTGKITIKAKLDGFAPSEPYTTELGGGQALDNLRLVLRVGGRIEGEVMPSRTGERVDGRRVTARQDRGGESYDATTDRSGKFTFKAVAPGDYAVAADAAATEVDLLRDPGPRRGNDWELMELTKKRGRVSVADGASARIVLGAPPAAPVIVSGRVHRGSQGAAGLRIVAQADGENGWERRRAARTDENGQYQVTVDEPGKFQVQVTANGRGGTTIGKHIDVPAAGVSDVDFALPAGRIAGRVRGPDGEELGWVRVQISRLPVPGEQGSEWTSGNTQTGDGGEFEFKDLPAGQFTLEVSGSSWNRRTFEQRQYGMVKHEVTLAESQEKDDVEIRLVAAGVLEVSVQMADGSKASNGRMTVRRTDVGQASIDDNWFSDGEAKREDLEPGTYEVRIEVAGQVSPEPEVVSITSSQKTSITVRLREGGFVKFKAVDGQGAPVQAMATLVDGAGRPLHSDRPLYAGQTSSPLPPGKCRVIGRDGAGKTVEGTADVKAGETAEVTLTFE